ncbi:Alpha/beta hydrolase family protein (plasmid) [Marinibacterium anthonyi]|nr:Alpha/beta hydrolase family protein [Marinibacterium anthonyi]
MLGGHSWGGMVITGAADRLAPGKLRRLVYHSAFVPTTGESLMDLCPPNCRVMFDQMRAATGTVGFPEPVFSEEFMNDASAE